MLGFGVGATVDAAAMSRLALALALSAVLHVMAVAMLEAAPAKRLAAGVPLQAVLTADAALSRSETGADPMPGTADEGHDPGFVEQVLPSRMATPDATLDSERTPELSRQRDRTHSSEHDAHGGRTQPSPPISPAAQADSTQRSAAPTSPEPAPASGSRLAEEAGVGLHVPTDTTYHTIAALDRPPVPLSQPDACYPQGATGEVVYELLIDERGTVRQADVLSVQPQGLFTAAAAELCARLKFSPAVKEGRSVRSRVRFVVGRG